MLLQAMWEWSTLISGDGFWQHEKKKHEHTFVNVTVAICACSADDLFPLHMIQMHHISAERIKERLSQIIYLWNDIVKYYFKAITADEINVIA